MTTRRTIIGSICGLLAIPMFAQSQPAPRLIPGAVATKLLPLRGMASMPLEEYDAMKADAEAYKLLKRNLTKTAEMLIGKPVEEELTMIVCRKVDGSIVPASEAKD